MTGCCGKVSGRLSDIVASLSLIIVMRPAQRKINVYRAHILHVLYVMCD